MPERVILVRHGHVEGIDQPRFRGRQHLQLTAAGLQQAEQTAAYLHRLVRPDAIVCSPMARCIATGAVVGQPAGLAPMPDEGLSDLDYGEWQGKLVADLRRTDPRVAEWFTDPASAAFPGGETLVAASERVHAAVSRIIRQRPGQTVIMVCHEATNRLILLMALALPLSRFHDLAQDPGSVSRLGHDCGRWTVLSMNETAHLAPTLSRH